MKRILGLDLGTNSIGWAIVEKCDQNGKIIKSGSRIIPMDAATLGDFARGNTKSQTAERTKKRSVRRIRERVLLRRERLHRILKMLGYLPKHYEEKIGWDIENDMKHYGTFLDGEEPKLPWRKDENGKPCFIFRESFEEMLRDFGSACPDLVAGNKKVPYDWTIYYLRAKALTQEVSKEELAWIILNFNQKRGYHQLRDEVLVDMTDKMVEYKRLKVSSVTVSSEDKKARWYEIRFENSDLVYRRQSRYPLEWEGKIRDVIVTTKLDENGKPKLKKDGSIDYSIKSPNQDDWAVLKLKTEQDLRNSGMTVGQYIYSALLRNPDEKIRGGLVHTIERDHYKAELEKILRKQAEFHVELTDGKLYQECIKELYSNNESHRYNISRNDFVYLILEDVLFYQRPLKSKKSLIDDCPYEYHMVVDRETGEIRKYPIKCISKSNPYFQEYRVWKFISDLRIVANVKELNGNVCSDVDVTSDFITNSDDIVNLFYWLNDKGSIDQKSLLSYLGIAKKEQGNYRWNYVEDKVYPMNATRHVLLSKLEKNEILSRDLEQSLWHLLYSVKSKEEIEKSLSPSAKANGIYHRLRHSNISCESINRLKTAKLSDEGYGAYSEKAIKKLLSVMRQGALWSADSIDDSVRMRIAGFRNGENMHNLSERVKAMIATMDDISKYKGLPEWLACYVVYGRHSEASEVVKWKTPDDINIFLNNFKQHSLRNPIVECVILETLRVVRDIWASYGDIDEIHIELGRELKNPSDKRAKITQQVLRNEATNLRIKALLAELVEADAHVENVRPFSPGQQELLRIYEESVLENYTPDEAILSIITELQNPTKQPSHADVIRYKCWLDQKYRSPYTGLTISLSKLFTTEYEIEHIIPQSRYFDDSFANKVICESEVNKLKDNQLGYEFIKRHHGEMVTLSNGRVAKIFEVEEYEQFVKDNYSSNNLSSKRRHLLMDEIPNEFIDRQLNDSRYISKVIKGLLSNIVRFEDENGELEREAISKNVITCSGKVTDVLKRDWGMGEIWNSIILPRFTRLNELTGCDCFTAINQNGHEIPTMPLELQKGFNKKRIDHRHHAMDAIVIACTSREHVNLLSNEASKPENKEMKYALSHQLRKYEDIVVNGKVRKVPKEFVMPWPSFLADARNSLLDIIVSFKQNVRVVNNATNSSWHYVGGIKERQRQNSSEHYAIRKSLHKDTVFGRVNLRRIKEMPLKTAIADKTNIVDRRLRTFIQELAGRHFNDKQIFGYFVDHASEWKDYDFKKIKLFYFTDDVEPMVATRFMNDVVSIFSGKSKREDIVKVIDQITDTGIQKIFLNYLDGNEENIASAFSAEGLESFNENIEKYNGGKKHKHIKVVRLCQALGNKFVVGHTGNKSKKFVVADAGTNLYFAVYVTTSGQRKYRTLPLEEIIERKKQKLSPVPDVDIEGNKLLFYLSPNDLVYVPNADEDVCGNIDLSNISKDRIYRFVDSSGTTANFVPHQSASVIYHLDKAVAKAFCKGAVVIQDEYGQGSPQSKNQKAITGEMIKEICVPVCVNRVGNLIRND